MTLILNKCIEHHDDRKECVAEENGKTYKLINRSGVRIRKVRVDKCLPQQIAEKRCDYLMDIDARGKKRVVFIELKGGGLVEALRQLYSTISYLKNEFKNHQIDARIVGSRDVPAFVNASDHKKLARLIKPTGGTIDRRTNKIFIETV